MNIHTVTAQDSAEIDEWFKDGKHVTSKTDRETALTQLLADMDAILSKATHNQAMPKGGRREGAGRKPKLPEGTKQWNIQVTDEEKAKIKALLEELRKPSK